MRLHDGITAQRGPNRNPRSKYLKEFDQQVVNGAASPVLVVPKLSDFKVYSPLSAKVALSAKTEVTHFNN